MLSRRSRLSGVALLVLSATLMTACAGGSEPAPTTTGNARSPEAPTPEPTSTSDAASVDTEDPTCETLIGESVVSSFEESGWTSRAEPLYIGGTEVSGGLRCVWADFSTAGGDHGVIFGWAEIDAGEAADAQEELLAQGWQKEESSNGVIITESADTAIVTDEDGYGMTYLFGEGWVKLADTKQGLLLIEWPRG